MKTKHLSLTLRFSSGDSDLGAAASRRRIDLASLRLCVFALILLPLCLPAATNDLSGGLQKGLFEEEANRDLDAAIQAYQSVAARFDKDRQLAATAIFRLGECYRKQGKTNEAVLQYERIVREFSDEPSLATFSRQNLAGLRQSPVTLGDAPMLSGVGNASEEASRLDAQLKGLEQLKDNPEEQARAVLAFFPDETLKKMLLQLSKLKEQEVFLRANSQVGSSALYQRIGERGGYYTAFSPDGGLAREAHGTNLVTDAQGELAKQLSWIKERVDFTVGVQKARLQVVQAVAAKTPVREGGTAEKSAPTTDDEEKEIRRIQAMIKDSPDLIEAKDQARGVTPLHSAAGLGQLRVATFLIANGADVGAKDRMWNGATPLHYAADAGHKGMIELLLSSKADANAATDNGETPLHFAARKGFKSIVELLLANRADVNAKLKGGATPLHYAVANGFKNVAETLLKAKADLNAVTTHSISSLTGGGSYVGAPLHIAISRGDRAIWELLLANGADVNVKDHLGRTPLRIAVEQEQTTAIETLLAKNANANIADYQETAPLLIAVERQKVEFVRALLDHNADLEAAGRVYRSLSGGGSVNRHTYPLQSAIDLGNLEVLELLLERGVEVNSPRTWSEPIYPIFGALNRERTNALKLLLKFKADPNVKSSDGTTPLMTAVNHGVVETVDVLLAAGADMKVAQEDGVTPLHMAVRDDKREIAALLLTKGADPNARNQNGETPLDWAKQRSSSAMPPGYPAAIRVSGVGVPSIPGGPRTPRIGGVGDNQPKAIADLLRRHGALDELPDFTSIRITRGTLKPVSVFGKDADAMNRFTLLEAILNLLGRNVIVLSGNSSAIPSSVFPFPDLSRVRIQRFSPTKPTERKEIVINLLTATNSIDCTKDVPLEFGDVIEIPEREHALSDQPVALVPQQRDELQKCTARIVRFVVKGETAEVRLSGIGAFLNYTLQYAEVQRILRSSSNLSRIQVKRTDSKTGKTREILVDALTNKQADGDLWLRDGDVIEVPDKP